MKSTKNDRALGLCRFVGWYFCCSVFLFWGFGYNYLDAILSSASLYQNSFADFTSLSGQSFVLFFTFVNYLSYMAFLAMLPSLFVLTVTYFYPNRWLTFTLSILTATSSLVLLVIDSAVYTRFKFHLNQTILSFLFDANWQQVFDFSSQEILTIMLIILGIFVLEILLALFVWKVIIQKKRCQVGKTLTVMACGGLVFSYFTLMHSIDQNNNLFSQQTPNLPLFNQLFVHLIPDKNAKEILKRYSEYHFAQPEFANQSLNYPKASLQCKKQKNPYNIILIMVDSLRFDSLKKQSMPHVYQFAQQSWQFMNHISGGNATQPGLFSLFYSLPSTYWTAARKQEKAPVFFEVLDQNGYQSKVVWSSEMHNPPFHETIYRTLSNLRLNGAPGEDVAGWDRHTTDQAISFLKHHNPKQPMFLNLFYDAPHGYCLPQSYAKPFQPALKRCSRIAMSQEMDPKPFYNRYLNAVHFVDQEIAKVIKAIHDYGYDENSIVVITSDHGQEFNDNHKNYWGHASNFTPVQVQVPMIIHWPHQKPQQFFHTTSSYDWVPTILTRLFQCQNAISDYSIGKDLLNLKQSFPFLLVGSYVNMGIVAPQKITVMEASGQISIMDKQAKPLVNQKPDGQMIQKALKLMRAYYQ